MEDSRWTHKTIHRVIIETFVAIIAGAKIIRQITSSVVASIANGIVFIIIIH